MSLFKSIGDELADFVDWIKEQLEDEPIRRAIAEDLGLQPGESVPKANIPQEQLDGIARYRSQANPDKEAFIILLNDVRAVYESVLEATANGIKTFDLGGHATTSEFTDAVVDRIRTKIEVWSTLGTR